MMTDRVPRLEMRGVSKRFGATAALDAVDFDVGAGEVHALVGENGAGKSTLMKVLSGAVSPDAGEIRLDGSPYRPQSPLDGRRAGVAMIYQELSLAPHLSVEENIVLGAEPSAWGMIRRGEVRQRARDALRPFDHPEIRPEMRLGALTVGARQVVEIARALAVGCRVLVLDEPTSSLSRQDAARLFGILCALRGQGQAIVYISHFIEEVKQIADRVTVLRDGRVAGARNAKEISVDGIVSLMVGREVHELYPRSPRCPGEVVLEVQDLSGRRKPTGVRLELRRGEVLGIAGLVGAGRTELLRMLFGLDSVRSGQIRLGAYVGPASPLRRWQQGAGMISEDRQGEGLAVKLSVADNVTLSNLRGFGPAGIVLPMRQETAAKRWIDRLGIRCRNPRDTVQTLSGGNQQKVALARLLQHDVDVLMLDEPTRGIDVGSRAAIYEMVDRLASGQGEAQGQPRAILIVSSYLPELLGVCDRIAVMCRGCLGAPRPVAEIDEHQVMMEAIGEVGSP